MIHAGSKAIAAFLALAIGGACGSSDLGDYCDTRLPGVQVDIRGYPPDTDALVLVVREDSMIGNGCSLLWSEDPTGLAEDRVTVMPGEVPRSPVALSRYDRLTVLAYAYAGDMILEGACFDLIPPDDTDTVCLILEVEPEEPAGGT